MIVDMNRGEGLVKKRVVEEVGEGKILLVCIVCMCDIV